MQDLIQLNLKNIYTADQNNFKNQFKISLKKIT